MKALATLAAASVLALGGAAALAQTTPPPPSPPAAPASDQAGDRGPGLTRGEMDSLTNARIAAIRAGLNLNADQQRLFGPVEQALRAMATDRADRVEERREAFRGGRPAERLDLSQRLERQAERATRLAQNLNALSNAMKPFYASLDDSQKRLLPMLIRPGGSRGGRGAMGGHGDHHRMMMEHGPMGRGMMGDQRP